MLHVRSRGIFGDVREVHRAQTARGRRHQRAKEPVDLPVMRGDEKVGLRDPCALFLAHAIVAEHSLVVRNENLFSRGLEVDELERGACRRARARSSRRRALQGTFAPEPDSGSVPSAVRTVTEALAREEPARVRRDVQGDSAGTVDAETRGSGRLRSLPRAQLSTASTGSRPQKLSHFLRIDRRRGA